MRLFIAVDLNEFKDYFITLQNLFPKNDAKLTFPKSFHLTLKFLGDVPDNKIEIIKNLLKKIRFRPLEIKIGGFGFFTEQYLRVIFLNAFSKELYELQRNIDDALSDLFPKEKRWQAHITLARVKFVKDKKGYIEKIREIKTEEKTITINSFKLMKSTLNKEGPIYDDLEVFKAK